ncbi:muts domain V-domain-containing protein, partial [Cladochytrium replicatum]
MQLFLPPHTSAGEVVKCAMRWLVRGGLLLTLQQWSHRVGEGIKIDLSTFNTLEFKMDDSSMEPYIIRNSLHSSPGHSQKATPDMFISSSPGYQETIDKLEKIIHASMDKPDPIISPPLNDLEMTYMQNNGEVGARKLSTDISEIIFSQDSLFSPVLSKAGLQSRHNREPPSVTSMSDMCRQKDPVTGNQHAISDIYPHDSVSQVGLQVPNSTYKNDLPFPSTFDSQRTQLDRIGSGSLHSISVDHNEAFGEGVGEETTNASIKDTLVGVSSRSITAVERLRAETSGGDLRYRFGGSVDQNCPPTTPKQIFGESQSNVFQPTTFRTPQISTLSRAGIPAGSSGSILKPHRMRTTQNRTPFSQQQKNIAPNFTPSRPISRFVDNFRLPTSKSPLKSVISPALSRRPARTPFLRRVMNVKEANDLPSVDEEDIESFASHQSILEQRTITNQTNTQGVQMHTPSVMFSSNQQDLIPMETEHMTNEKDALLTGMVSTQFSWLGKGRSLNSQTKITDYSPGLQPEHDQPSAKQMSFCEDADMMDVDTEPPHGNVIVEGLKLGEHMHTNNEAVLEIDENKIERITYDGVGRDAISSLGAFQNQQGERDKSVDSNADSNPRSACSQPKQAKIPPEGADRLIFSSAHSLRAPSISRKLPWEGHESLSNFSVATPAVSKCPEVVTEIDLNSRMLATTNIDSERANESVKERRAQKSLSSWLGANDLSATTTDEEEDSSEDEAQFPKRSERVPLNSALPELIEHRRDVARIFREGDDEDVEDKVVMTISYRSKKLGTAYYSVAKSRVYLMQDMFETDDFELVRMLKVQVRPNIIVVGSRTDEALMEILRENDGSMPLGFSVEVRPSTDFLYEGGKSKLLSIKVNGDGPESRYVHIQADGQLGPQADMMIYLESVISLGNQEMVCCAGALLTYVAKARLTGEIYAEDGASGREMEVTGVELFNLNKFVHVNMDAMCSLQIFCNEAHPGMHSKRTKEGLSLFGLLDNTRTPAGRALLKQWFLRPSRDITVLRERHLTIQYLLRSDHSHNVNQIRDHLKHVKSITKTTFHLKTKVAIHEWHSLVKFALYALKIRTAVQEFSSPTPPIVQKINQYFSYDNLREIGVFISSTLDFDESGAENRFVVKPQVDDELDEMKRTYNGLDDLLSAVARTVVDCIPPQLGQDLNVIYFPQLGYLITVPRQGFMRTAEDYVVDRLVFQFATESSVYYKNDQMFALDEQIGDIHSLIVDRESAIVQKLQETILTYKDTILKVLDTCAEIDCLISLAEAARIGNFKMPEMTNENLIEIVKGRHPLHELISETFVENDCRLGSPDKITDDSEWHKVMLLTGPNFSGKSVYIKQVALITFMAHVGSFVPAERARIGLVDKIFTRVHTRESVTKVVSAFMIDLHQVAVSLRNATRRSLVIIDEFGKGTEASNGIGLFCATLDTMLRREADCPIVLAATHFHEIFQWNLIRKRPLLGAYTMDMVIDPRSLDSLTFLYRVTPGICAQSWGIACGARAGLPFPIINREAREFAERMQQGEPIDEETSAEEEARYLISKEILSFFRQADFTVSRSTHSIDESGSVGVERDAGDDMDRLFNLIDMSTEFF